MEYAKIKKRGVTFTKRNISDVDTTINAPKPSPIDLSSYIDDGISIIEIIKKVPSIFTIMKALYILYKDITMSNDKISTIKGIIRAAVMIGTVIAAWFSFEIPANTETILSTAVIAIWGLVELILGIFQNKKPKEEV